MLKIVGGQKISGTVEISGSKNASLPIIAASLLLKKVKLNNMPRIGDVFTFLEIIKSLGIKVKFEKDVLELDNSGITLDGINSDLIKKIRAGILIIPSILHYFGEINIPYPGGCNIGKRPIYEH
ncbi:UDP-N-acetylglucosamine 1-carboxyvinyltransferase, partial [Candidatus Gracilibacteria bacterium]|nr:UDP-N-acetylglucosamine 1-carboxyvinyltransferase [Candidatus Gracilibacteria bacterium]